MFLGLTAFSISGCNPQHVSLAIDAAPLALDLASASIELGKKGYDKISDKFQSNEKPSSSNLQNIEASEICKGATYNLNNKIYWLSEYSFWQVKEAKRRGLDCGVGNNNKVAVISMKTIKTTSVFTKQKITEYSNKYVCAKAVAYNSKWETQSKYLKYVQEAKLRGLDCGVKNGKSIVAVASSNINSYSNTYISI